jgi:hypothetical protein
MFDRTKLSALLREEGLTRLAAEHDFRDDSGRPIPDHLIEFVVNEDVKGLAEALDAEHGEEAYLHMEYGVGLAVRPLLGSKARDFRQKVDRMLYKLRDDREKAAIASSPWKKELKALKNAIDVTVSPNDVPYIKYQPRKKKGLYWAAYIEDFDQRLGHSRWLLTEDHAQRAGTDLKTVFKALDDMGATLAKRGMGPGKKKPWIDYDGWAY